MIVAYVALFAWFDWRRHMSYRVGEWDLGVCDQSFFTAARLGLPFYNTYEAGSHFGFHWSPIFYLVLPLYALAPSPVTLAVAQTVALALGAVPVYLLARDLIGPRAGVAFSALYLLYFPLHGIDYHDVHETGFCVAPLMLALWGLRTARRGALWTGAVLALGCREDMGLLLIGMGLLGLWWRREATRADAESGRPEFERVAPAMGDCMALMGVGLISAVVAFAVLIPWFGAGRRMGAVTDGRFSHLGEGPLAWALSPLLRPGAFWGSMMRDTSVSYVLGLLAPLAFLPLRAWPALLVMLPVLLMNLTSSFGGMHLFTSHYAGPLIAFVFAAGIEGTARVLWRRGEGDEQSARVLRPAWVITVATMLAFDPSPLHAGWKVKPVDDHARALDAMVTSIAPDASVSTTPNVWPHLTRRLHVWPRYEAGVEYVLVDTSPASAQFVRESGFDRTLPPLLREGRYTVCREADGVVLYRRAEGVPALSRP